MVQAYWNIGRCIVEYEQAGNVRAEYGKAVMQNLSKSLTAEFGKGFTETNLKYMRLFDQTFPIHHALRAELSWTHYRMIMRVENPDASKYQLMLPTEEELKRHIKQERRRIEKRGDIK